MAPETQSAMKNREKRGSKMMKLIYMQCYFVTLATILGTGILGLPVTLAHSGIYPFLVSFVGGFIFQIILVLFFTDLLQRAHALQIRRARESQGSESVPLNDIAADELDLEDIEDEQETNGPVLAGHVIIPKEMISVRPPNLHLLGELFLGCGLRQLFDILILFHFVAILISYALAGSEAYAEVIGTNYLYVIPVFVWTLTFFIVFALSIIQPIVSILTFLKGSLLLATVGVTFVVGAQIHHEIINDFAYLGAPFLMGTVALGGVVNVMPFLYGKISPVQSQVRGFRSAVVGGIVTCAVLNILWCWSVLEIVPQLNSCFTYNVKMNNSFHYVQESSMDSQMVCSHNLSLESAGKQGQISTIPLTQIIHQLYPQFNWIAVLIEMFITISVTVSYLTVGAALHHTLSGWVDSLWSQDRYATYTTKMELADSKLPCCNTRCICRSLLSLTVFGVVFAIAMMNPQGFVSLLEKIASLALNLEAGIFVFVMMLTARNSENRKLKIPLPLPRWIYHLLYLLPIYFGFAVGYDLYISIRDLVNKGVLDHDLHKGLHVGGPFTAYGNVTDEGGMLSAINGSTRVNFTDFVTGDEV